MIAHLSSPVLAILGWLFLAVGIAGLGSSIAIARRGPLKGAIVDLFVAGISFAGAGAVGVQLIRVTWGLRI